jgi:hypothetical protein
LPSGEAELYRIALKLKDRLEPLSNTEVDTIKAKGLTGDPIFKYPAV